MTKYFAFVNNIASKSVDSLKELSQQLDVELLILRDSALPDYSEAKKQREISIGKPIKMLVFDFDNHEECLENIYPIREQVIGITAHRESHARPLSKLVAYFPYLETPTSTSLEWATDKLKMRQNFKHFDTSISPNYLLVEDASQATLENIENSVGYPCIVKPATLASSILIHEAKNREELGAVLKNAIEVIGEIYESHNRNMTPQLLVEERMIGDLYSTDTYVDGKGNITFCPVVYYKSNKEIGIDDFSIYYRTSFTNLSTDEIDAAFEATEKGVKALGLKSTTCHVELIKTENGWKIIEIGPRIGRFRHELYYFGFGIDHYLNDSVLRAGIVPKVNFDPTGFAVAYTIYPQKEGIVKEVRGLEWLKGLAGMSSLRINVNAGEHAKLAKNGGDDAFAFVLSSKNLDELKKTMEEVEQKVGIVCE